MIPVIWHQIAKLITVFILENLGLNSSLSLCDSSLVLTFAMSPLSYSSNGIADLCNTLLPLA